MGNAESASVRILNETEIDLIYVISQVGPLYWGVLKPGERVTRETGRVWFTVTCYPKAGNKEPTTLQAVMGVVIPTVTAIAAVVSAGVAVAAATPAAGSAAAALAPLVAESAATIAIPALTGAAVTVAPFTNFAHNAFVADATRALNKVERVGHYANGDWIHVRGGIKTNEPHSAWKPMYFEMDV